MLILLLGPKMTHLLHFGLNKNLSKKNARHFLLFSNPYTMQKSEKNETIPRKRRHRQTEGRTDRQIWINRTLRQNCGSKSLDFFMKYWWSKNPTIWRDQRQNWLSSTKGCSLRSYHPLMVVRKWQIYGIDWFLAEISVIKEYCNLTNW